MSSWFFFVFSQAAIGPRPTPSKRPSAPEDFGGAPSPAAPYPSHVSPNPSAAWHAPGVVGVLVGPDGLIPDTTPPPLPAPSAPPLLPVAGARPGARPEGRRGEPIPTASGRHFVPSGRRRALMIGINYRGTRAELRGCIKDVHNMQRRMGKNWVHCK